MKKHLTILLLAATALAVNACGRDTPTVGSSNEPATESRSAGTGDTGAPAGAGTELAQRDTTDSATSDTQQSKGGAAPALPESSASGSSDAAKTGDSSGTAGSGSESAPGAGAQGAAADSIKASKPGESTNRTAESQTGSESQVGAQARIGQSGEQASESGAQGQQASANRHDVRQAQEALKTQGQNPGPIDGIMGPRTRQALREFQQENGLKQTGTLDAETKQKLKIEGSSS